MATKLVVFVALLALSNAALVRRDAPSEENSALKADVDTFLEHLTTFSDSLHTTITNARGKIKENLEERKKNLEKTLADLRKAREDLKQQGGKLSDQARAALKAGVQEVQKLAEEVQGKTEDDLHKLAPAFKEAIGKVAKSAGELHKKFHESDKQ